MQRGLFLDVVVAQGSAVFQLLPGKDKTLLIRGNAFLVLDLLLHVLDRVARFDVKGNRLTSQSLHENLHTTAKAKYQMQRGLFLDVVVAQGSAVFQLLIGSDKTIGPLIVHHHEGEVPNATWPLSGCCSRSRFGRLPVAYWQRQNNWSTYCAPPRRRSTKCNVASFWML